MSFVAQETIYKGESVEIDSKTGNVRLARPPWYRLRVRILNPLRQGDSDCGQPFATPAYLQGLAKELNANHFNYALFEVEPCDPPEPTTDPGVSEELAFRPEANIYAGPKRFA